MASSAGSPEAVTIAVPAIGASVPGLLMRPAAATRLLVLGHGAGAGMSHPFMADVAERLARRQVATLRYQFPYMDQGRRRPDRAPVLEETARSAVARAAELCPDLPLFAGGKSMGGRMTSRAAAAAPLPGVRGLVFLGFPLHPAGRPGDERARHLERVTAPMLFVQGDRDRLADLSLLEPVLTNLGDRATLHLLPGADHGFHVLRRSGRTDAEVLESAVLAVADWTAAR